MKTVTTAAVAAISLAALIGCGDRKRTDAPALKVEKGVPEAIKAQLGSKPSFLRGDAEGQRVWKAVRAFYEKRKHAPVWVDGRRPTESLDALLEIYREPLRRIVRLRMGREARRTADSMDMVQETFAVAARRIEDFEPRDHASILRWLLRIAEHQIQDLIERERAEKRDRRRTVSLQQQQTDSSDSHPGFEPPGREESPSQELAARELHDLYDACVEELPPAQRDVVVLRNIMIASWEEIAHEIGARSTGAAKELYRRACEKLGELLRRRLGREYE